MNILYFASTAFYQKPNPSFHLMTSMIEDLLDRGDHVYFVGVKDKHLDKHIPDKLAAHPRFHFELVKRSKVKKTQFALRYLRGITYALSARSKLKKFIDKCDVVFVQSSATILYNTLAVKSVAQDQRVIINIQDMFPGSSVASGVMPRKWMQNIFYALQKMAYSKADVIVGISEDMKIKLIEQGVPEEKIRVVLNWFDDKSVHEIPWEENRFVRKYGMTRDKFYVQYAGTMGYVFNYKVVLQVAEKLKGYSDIEIQMIGEGSQKSDFIHAAETMKLDNIKFLPLEPQEMVSDVYSACSVCLIPLKHGIIGNSVPSKAGLLMACKRPIVTLADAGCEYAKEINDNRIGFACADDDPHAVVNAILSLYHDRDECIAMGKRGYEHGRNLYSRSENMKKFFDIFAG